MRESEPNFIFLSHICLYWTSYHPTFAILYTPIYTIKIYYWKDQISKVNFSASKIPDGNCIDINNKYMNIDKGISRHRISQ